MIKGLIAPILSPFNDDLSFNQDLYNALAAELLQTGCSGLAPFGTTGEALSVSSAERKAALEGLVASGIDPKVIIPGTGLCNLPESIALSRHAVDLGCAGVAQIDDIGDARAVQVRRRRNAARPALPRHQRREA